MASLEACSEHFSKLYACLALQPLSHWECSEDMPAIREGFCEKEQAAASGCLEAKLGK
jgi:hypothetical protein